MDEERNRYENSILGAGMMWSTLRAGGAQAEPIVDADGGATNALLVKIPIGGPSQERGYIVTVTIPGHAMVEVEGYVWCDKEGAVHSDTLNPYGYVEDGKQDYCKPENHRKLLMEADDV